MLIICVSFKFEVNCFVLAIWNYYIFFHGVIVWKSLKQYSDQSVAKVFFHKVCFSSG
jgi:hypothetical protein